MNGQVRPVRERGAALITAILIVALVSILAGNMLWSSNLDRRRAESLLHTDQALHYALGGETWAAEILRQDLQNSQSDHLGEEWAVALPPLPIEGGYIEGLVEDMQGRFNINNLVGADGGTDPDAVAQFQRLLELLELEPRLAPLAADWLDADVETGFPDGAEDDVYTALEPPYRTANTAVTSTSELLAVDGYDLQTYRILSPYVTALPPGTLINVNTAPAAIVQSAGEGISASDAESIVEQARELGYEDLGELEQRLPPEALAGLGVASQFFRVTTRVTLGTTVFSMYSLVERDAQGGVRVRLRHFGTE